MSIARPRSDGPVYVSGHVYPNGQDNGDGMEEIRRLCRVSGYDQQDPETFHVAPIDGKGTFPTKLRPTSISIIPISPNTVPPLGSEVTLQFQRPIEASETEPYTFVGGVPGDDVQGY